MSRSTLCSISRWILLLVTLLTLSLVSQSASRGTKAPSTAPLWRLDLRSTGYIPPQHGLDDQEIGSLLGIEPVCFLGNGVVVVSYVTREVPVALPRRGQTDESLPYRLRAIFIDTKTGAVSKTMEWPTASVRSRILAAPGEKFAVLTPDQMLLYSADFALLNKLEVSLGRESVKSGWDAAPSPGGRYLLLGYEPATDEKRFAGLPLSVYDAQLDTLEMHLIWVDLEKLQVVEHWTTTRRSSGGFSWPEKISDQGLVQIESSMRNRNGIPLYLPIVKIGRPPNGPWQLMCTPSDSFCGPGQFINDGTVIRSRLSGGDKNVQTWIGLVSTNGKLLFEQSFPKGEVPRDGIPVSSDGRRFALGLMKIKGGNSFLDIAGHASMSRIMVYDLAAHQWVYSLDAKAQNIKDVSGMALSQDGSLLGEINQDGVLEVYRVPEAPGQAAIQ